MDQQQLSQTGYYVSVIFAIISFSNYEVNLNKTLFDLNNVYRFQTVAGKKICLYPETAWVSGHVDKVDKRTTTATKTPATTTTATTAKTQSLTV